MRRGMVMGADDYLTKPFEVDELLQVVSIRLQKRQLVSKLYTEQIKQLESEINYLVHHDKLTGLPNQLLLAKYFNEHSIRVDSQNELLPLLMINIDISQNSKLSLTPGFRQLFIKLLSKQLYKLQASQKMIDFIAHLDNDRLALFLKPVINSDQVANISEEILDCLSKPLFVNNTVVYVKAKISIAFYPFDGLNLDALLTNAEITLQHHQLEDSNSYYFHSREIMNVVFRKVILESDFQEALNKNQFILNYQPQIDLNTGKVLGAEALVRWRHHNYGMISPAEFVPLPEECGFINKLGEWVIKKACSDFKQLESEGLEGLKVAVNVSPYQFRQENLAQRIHDIVNETNFNCQQLELELTETVFIADIDAVKNTMDECNLLGIHNFSIDDFGTGYSSLKYLQEFSFKHLKIDQYFVRNIDSIQNKQSIVQSMLKLAEKMNIDVIVEGVENQNEFNWLKQNQCNCMQGYFFSHPLAIEYFKIF